MNEDKSQRRNEMDKDSITINGVDYVRKSAVPTEWPKTSRAIVVIDRGWIYAGDVEDVLDDLGRARVRIHNAIWVFRWEKISFSGVVEDPSQADLRPMAQPVDLPAASEIYRVPVPEGWGL